ncbi:MAG: hypothetical protein NC177_01175 [Ruminococcus flavefaciens]|nr:hypothetical protein [Ruminococcus flavefaciens]
MAKRPVTFDTDNERDKKILDDIEIYMKENQIEHRISAVRNLCEIALEIDKIINKKNKPKIF